MRLENLHGYLKFPGPFPVASIRLKFVARGAAASRFVPREDGGAVSPDEPDTGADAALSEVPDRDRAVEVAGLSPDMLPRQGELDLGGNDPQLRHLDHAWASTVHAFQGRTVDNVIAAMEARHPHLTTQKSFTSRSAGRGTGRNWSPTTRASFAPSSRPPRASASRRSKASERWSARRRRSPLRSGGRRKDNRFTARDGIPGRNATARRHRRKTGICPHPNAAAARTGTSDCDAARPERDGAGRNDRLKKGAGHDGQQA